MLALRARWVFPVDRPPIADGVVQIADGRIVTVGKTADGPVRDLNVECGHDVALTPGLVNAHTHLELSDCREPFPAGVSFASWIRQVVAWRRTRAAQEAAGPGAPAEPPVEPPVARGCREVWETGTCTVGDIASPGWRSADLAAFGGRVVVFQELLGLPAARIEPNLTLAMDHLQGGWQVDRLQPGLSPHAPYTVHPALFARSLALAAAADGPVAFHLAETREELELLAAGTGPLRALLEDFGAWEPGALPTDGRPLHYLQQMAAAGVRGLVIHGNYLAEDEIALLAAHRERLSVVYCPRTHAHFGHAPHPWPRLRAAGVNVALGTDSRASNPDLELWADACFAASGPGGLSPAAALELATRAGAQAVGLAADTGTLTPGKGAELSVFPVASRPAADPHELLLETHPRPLPAGVA